MDSRISRTNFNIYLKTARGELRPKNFHGILHLPHNEDFGLGLENNSSVRTKAECYVSGENIGTLVLRPGEIVVVNHPIEGVNRRFRYVSFNSPLALDGNLNENKCHTDEITVIFSPEKLSPIKEKNIYCAAGGDKSNRVVSDFSLPSDSNQFENPQVGSACGSVPDFCGPMSKNVSFKETRGIPVPDFCGPISKNVSFKETRGINVACDAISDRGGAVLGPNLSHQKFVRVSDFETSGKFYFTIVMRTLHMPNPLPSILPISYGNKFASL